jgi:tetracycline repressor-like protein
VVGELRPYPDGGGWLEVMLDLGMRQRDLYRRHPWLLDLVHRPSTIGPQALSWFDNCLRILQPVQCGIAAKFEAIAMMTGVATLFARSEASGSGAGFAGVDRTAYPHLAAAFERPLASVPQDDLFERILRIVLLGLLADERPGGS